MRACYIAVIIFISTFLGYRSAATPMPAPKKPFYEGKVLTQVVGLPPGGAIDIFARLQASWLEKYIPGHPTVITQSMKGAGGIIAANHVYRMQPGDGLTIVMYSSAALINAVLGVPEVQFDARKFIYLAHPRIGVIPGVLWVRSDLPYKSLADLRAAKEPLRVGASLAGSFPYSYARLAQLAGLPIKIVTGYAGGTDTALALRKGEIHGHFWPPVTMKVVAPDLVATGAIRPLLAIGSHPKDPPPAGIATMEDLNLTPKLRRLAEFLLASLELQQLHAVPPGTPSDRVKILREAHKKAFETPELLDKFKDLNYILDPLDPAEIEARIQALYDAPQEIKNEFAKVMMH